MCGIVGYIGQRDAAPFLLHGLKRLEYRGYDSAGIVLLRDHQLKLFKKMGKVRQLEEALRNEDLSGQIGIGHTRWATHGPPSDINAHPHLSFHGNMAMIHNGIIENYMEFKLELAEGGILSKSETDSEVLLNYIEFLRRRDRLTLKEAMRIALGKVRGAYCILLLDTEAPDRIFAARKGSPLVIGISGQDFLLASDAAPLLGFTKLVVYPDDGALIEISVGSLQICDLEGQEIEPLPQVLDLSPQAIEKGGYPHFMLKEIYEQPETFKNCLLGRLDLENGELIGEEIDAWAEKLHQAPRIIIVSCGSSWHAGLLGEYWIETLTRIPVEVEYASEFRYRNPVILPGDIILAISQSGETADTLVALEQSKASGARVFSIVNVVGSSIARASESCAYTHAGPEIGVASTKTFLGQLGVLLLLALGIARKKGTLEPSRIQAIGSHLANVPTLLQQCLARHEEIRRIGDLFKGNNSFIFLGRGYNFPIALEGALKLKEIAIVHADGYPAAEMKHGPIALVDEYLPVVFVATRDAYFEKILSNIQEIKARQGRVIAITNEGESLIPKLAEHMLTVPPCDEMVAPILSTVLLQLLSYEIGIQKGLDVDQPRNLAKSVTVE
jgi:glucosamine--fructose-6-phosphate aminotransferase (isomerizing)